MWWYVYALLCLTLASPVPGFNVGSFFGVDFKSGSYASLEDEVTAYARKRPPSQPLKVVVVRAGDTWLVGYKKLRVWFSAFCELARYCPCQSVVRHKIHVDLLLTSMLPLWVTAQWREGALGDLPWATGGLPGTSRKARYRCSQLERGSDTETSARRLPRILPISDKSLSVNIRQCFVHKIVHLLTCILRRFGNGMFLKWRKATQAAGRNTSCFLQLQVQGKTSLQTAADALFNALLFGVDATWKLKIPCSRTCLLSGLHLYDSVCIYHMPLSHVLFECQRVRRKKNCRRCRRCSNVALCRGGLLCGGPSQPWLPCTVGSAAFALHRSRGVAFEGDRCTKSSALVEVTFPPKKDMDVGSNWILHLCLQYFHILSTVDSYFLEQFFPTLKEDNGHDWNERSWGMLGSNLVLEFLGYWVVHDEGKRRWIL